ncbi:unnamed protein product [Musa acuminata subsp. malaccensis]|uniref:(wild Malaysian banana) hypothetical protein n=1 Tax=Musa acuminata subsp. malaccensis TaxID=214687 RepID=A0A804IY87_MUSAM|nr:unnamed protein product [Musa acuminata subsp. malaccensis]
MRSSSVASPAPKVLLSDHLLKDSDLQTRNVHGEDKSFRDMYVICQKE